VAEHPSAFFANTLSSKTDLVNGTLRAPYISALKGEVLRGYG
jgi:hypothetical protein